MADAYKGLTIQFGGDTTQLTRALAAAKSAAAETQSQLRLLNQALKFDSTSIETSAQKISLLNERAQTLGAQLNITATAMEQLAERTSATGSGQTIGELAESTENAALQAKLALDRYNSMNASLEQLYTKANAAAEGVEGLAEGLDFRDLSDNEFEAALNQLVEMGRISEEDAAELRSLRDSYADVAAALDDSKAVLKLQQMQTESQKLETEVKGLSDQMGQMLVPSELATELSSVRTRVTELDAAIAQTEAAAKAADEALKLDPSNVQLAEERTEALKNASQLTAEKAALLAEQLEAYKSAGIDKAVDDTKDMSVEAAKATSEWADANAELQKAKGWLQELENQQAKLTDAGKQTTDEYAANAAAIEQARAQVEDLSAAEQTAAQARENAQMAAEYQELQQEIAETTTEAEKFSAAIEDNDTTIDSLEEVSATIDDVADALNELAQLASSALSSIVSETDEVSAAFQDMKKTVDGTEEDFEELYDAALAASSESIVSASEILEIEALGGQLGIAVEDLEEFAEVVSNISIASDLETEEAAEQLGELSNILDDLNTDTMTNFADALVRLGNNTAASESKISNIATRIGSMGSIVGLTTPEILALSATVAETGMRAESAGTAISNTLSDMETAVGAVADMTEEEMEEAGAAILDFAEVAGMSGEDFAETWENEPIEALRAFINGLNEIEDSGGSADATLESLGITGTRQKQAIEGLMQTIDNLDENLQMSEDAWNGVADEWGAAGDAANEAEQKSEGFSGALSRLENSISNIAASLGEALTPTVTKLAEAFSDLSEWVADLSDDTKQFVVTLLEVTATTGPLALGVSKVVSAITKAAAANGSFLAGIASLGSTLGVVAAVIAGIVGTTALITYFSDLHEEMENSESASRTYADLMAEVSGNVDAATNSLSLFTTTNSEAVETANDAIESIGDFNDEIVDTLTEADTASASLEYYVDTIEELAGQSDLSAYQQALLEAAVEGVNEELGTAYEVGEDYMVMLDDEIVAVDDLIETLDESVEAYKRQAKAAAYSSLIADATEELVAAQQDLNEVEAAYESFLADTESASYQAFLSNLQDYADYYNLSLEDAVEKAYGAGATLEDAWESYAGNTELGQKYQELTSDVEKLENTINELSAAAAITSSTLNDELANAVLELPYTFQESATNIAYALQDAIDEGTITTEEAMDYMTQVVDETLSALPEVAQEDGLAMAEQLAAGVIDGSYTAEEAANYITHCITDVFDGSSDELAEIGTGLATALAGSIQDGEITVSGAMAIVQAAAKGTDEGWQEVLSIAETYGVDIGAVLASAINSGSISVDESTASMLADIVLQMNGGDVTAAAESLGLNLTEGTITGIEAGGEDAGSASEWLAEYMLAAFESAAEIQSPSKAMAREGEYLDEGLAEGVTSNTSTVTTATQSLMEAVTSKVDTTVSKAATWGAHLASNFASGLKSGKSAVSSAAQSLASAASSSLQFTIPEEGPWSGAEKGGYTSGMHLAENFASGLADGAEMVERAADGLARAATLSGAIESVQVETATALGAAVADVSANIDYSQTGRTDRTDELLHALRQLNNSVDYGNSSTRGDTYNVNMQALPQGELYDAMQTVFSLMQVAITRGGC